MLGVGGLVAGCGQNKTANNGGDATTRTTANPLRGYVRLDALIASHPLQADLRRLRDAEARLLHAATAASSRQAGGSAKNGYTLGPLPAAVTVRAAGATQARGERREEALRRLQGGFKTQMEAFQSERERRQQQLLVQRRDELMAVDALKVAEEQRLVRDEAFAGVVGQIEAKTGAVTKARTGIAVVQGQLDAPEARLPDNLDSFRIPHNLLREKRRDLRKRITALEAELEAIKKLGANQADLAAAAVLNRRAQAIEEQLESLREDAETQFVVRDQEEALQRALATEAALSARARDARIRLVAEGKQRDGGAGAVSLSSVFPEAVSQNGIVGARAAAARVARQRQRLEAFLRADIADAVRDVAQARHLDVTLITAAPVTTGSPQTQGRRDMTRQFAAWVKPGAAIAFASQPASVTSVRPRTR